MAASSVGLAKCRGCRGSCWLAARLWWGQVRVNLMILLFTPRTLHFPSFSFSFTTQLPKGASPFLFCLFSSLECLSKWCLSCYTACVGLEVPSLTEAVRHVLVFSCSYGLPHPSAVLLSVLRSFPLPWPTGAHEDRCELGARGTYTRTWWLFSYLFLHILHSLASCYAQGVVWCRICSFIWGTIRKSVTV